MNLEQSKRTACVECGERQPVARGLCQRCYKRWKRTTDPIYAEHDRQASVRWKDRNREVNRARDRARLADEERRGRCTTCDGLMGSGQFEDGTCKGCTSRAHNERVQMIERMWRDGASLKQIAEALNSTPAAIGVDMARMRAAGTDLPYRRQRKVAA